jgi:hypothetical protein
MATGFLVILIVDDDMERLVVVVVVVMTTTPRDRTLRLVVDSLPRDDDNMLPHKE